MDRILSAVDRPGAVGDRRRAVWRAFLADERGAITTDIALIFLPILLIILTVFEIGITFYFVLAAQKAAQMGARFIIAEDPLYTTDPAVSTAIPRTNLLDASNGQAGDSCFNPLWTGAADTDILVAGTPSPCVTPTFPDAAFNGWVCDGVSLDANCDAVAFGELVEEMQIVYPKLTRDLVTVRYHYEKVGYAGGPFQPRVEVAVKARQSPIQILSLLDLLWDLEENSTNLGPDEKVVATGVQEQNTARLREVSASVFGADLDSANETF